MARGRAEAWLYRSLVGLCRCVAHNSPFIAMAVVVVRLISPATLQGAACCPPRLVFSSRTCSAGPEQRLDALPKRFIAGAGLAEIVGAAGGRGQRQGSVEEGFFAG